MILFRFSMNYTHLCFQTSNIVQTSINTSSLQIYFLITEGLAHGGNQIKHTLQCPERQLQTKSTLTLFLSLDAFERKSYLRDKFI